MPQKYRFEDYIDKKINRWTILEVFYKIEKGKKRILVTAKCDCSNQTIKEIDFYNVIKGKSQSCGCLNSELSSERYKKLNEAAGRETHGFVGTHVYRCWISMRNRCYNKTNNRYYNYGARGIKVCDEWKDSFTCFLKDMGVPPTDFHTIDRIDVDKNYSKENCRWASPKEQSNNRSTCCFISYKGKTQSLRDWAKELNINYEQIRWQLSKGLSLEEIIKLPNKPYKERTRSMNKSYKEFKACTNI